MKMPNCLTSALDRTSALWPVVVALTLVVGLSQPALASHPQEPPATNEIPTSAAAAKARDHAPGAAGNFSQFSREVTNLRLSPDLRSIKLRWTYEHGDSNRPESFRIRYCELTSWMAEIKCRHRELAAQVQRRRPAPSQLKQTAPVGGAWAPLAVNGDAHEAHDDDAAADDDSNSTVITTSGAQLSAGNNSNKGNKSRQSQLALQVFETQIYDLRALTNYTFQVRVWRFVGEPTGSEQLLARSPRQQQQQQPRPGRRLELASPADAASEPPPTTTTHIESTKPFSAEALRCLANSSEVLVNTGRFFGGRISVEGQPDGRCQLQGNKSSEQAVYTFHIDHAACRSKVLDGNRIETMILVHENRDILTQNTARFLVQCNIGQHSFTVKASISLPRVMSSLGVGVGGGGGGQAIQAAPRQALITPLAGKPAPMRFDEGGDRVHLGSMPGVYRLLAADNAPAAAPNYLAASETATTSATSPASAPTTTSGGGGVEPVAARQSIVAAAVPQAAAQSLLLPPSPPPRHQRQSKELAAAASEQLRTLPKPVDVSSRLLFVERASGAVAPLSGQREARLMVAAGANQQSASAPPPMTMTMTSGNLLRKQQSTNHPDDSQTRPPARATSEPSARLTLAASGGGGGRRANGPNEEVDEGGAAAPLIMTNNHRVAGDFASLAPAAPLAGQSIKYSASQVDEYALNRLTADEAAGLARDQLQLAAHHQGARSRSGRMRHIGPSTAASAAASNASPTETPPPTNDGGLARARSIESRMGDALQPSGGAAAGEPPLLASRRNQTGATESELPAAGGARGHLQANQSAPVADDLQQQQRQQQHTAAQNITGALIRWSLKTLGQLARKSLESLVADEQEQGEAKGLSEEPRVAAGSTPWFAPAAFAPTSPASPPPPPPPTTFQAVKQTLKVAQPPRAVETARESNLASDSTQLDGFLIGSRPPAKPQTGARLAPRTTQKPLVGPAAQVAGKAGGLEVAQEMRQARHQRLGEQAPPASSTPAPFAAREAPRTSAALGAAPTKRGVRPAPAQEAPGAGERRSLWPLYGMWALCCLTLLIVLALYFVLLAPRPAHGAPGRQAKSPARNLFAALNSASSSAPAQAPQLNCPLGRGPVNFGAAHGKQPSLCYASQPHLAPGPQQAAASASSPLGSATTRSTSAASSSSSSGRSPTNAGRASGRGGVENYCKNQEQYVVYTDHLLLTDDSSSLGDDDSRWLTRSGRRRPPSESFA